MSENSEGFPQEPDTPKVELISREAQLQGGYNKYGQFVPFSDAFPSDDEEEKAQPQSVDYHEYYPLGQLHHTEYIPETEDWERTTRKWTDIGERYKKGTGFSFPALGIKGKALPEDEIRFFQKHGVIFEKELGSGSWGSVWSVSKTTIKQGKLETMRMACKVSNIKTFGGEPSFLDRMLSRQGPANVKEAVERLVSEGEIHLKLKHKNIVECKYVFKIRDIETGFPYCRLLMFMEFCDGDLISLIKKSPVQRFSENKAKEILRQVSEGLQYMHDKHICHLDIKSENILYVIKSGVQFIYKLSDLGFAIILDSDEHTLSGQIGTLDYMAPEIKSGESFLPKLGDIYSLGCVLAETVIGPKLWSKFNEELQKCTMDSVPAIASMYKITELCADLIFRMTNLDPGQRPTIGEVIKHDWILQKAPSN